MATHIHAIQVHNYGNPDQLKFEQITRPEPKTGQVLVRVHSAGVNPMDWKIRSGMAKNFMPQSFPYIPGADFAGVIESVKKIHRLNSDLSSSIVRCHACELASISTK